MAAFPAVTDVVAMAGSKIFWRPLSSSLKSVFLQILYNTSKGPIFAGDCYLLHHLIADMDTRLELGDEVAYHRRNLCS